MPKLELDVNSDTQINIHTHSDAEARPLVVVDTRTWLDSLGLTDVTFDVKKVFGPGGGASVIDFTGSEADLRKLAVAYDDGNGEVEYLMSHLVRD